MKNSKLLIGSIFILFLTAIPIFNFGQSTSDNNGTGLGKYLGYNGPQDLDFKTNNILRMQLMESQTNTINGFSGVA